jgi:hypothetical protein
MLILQKAEEHFNKAAETAKKSALEVFQVRHI